MRPTGGFRLRHPLGLEAAIRSPSKRPACAAPDMRDNRRRAKLYGGTKAPLKLGLLRLFWLFDKGLEGNDAPASGARQVRD